jgi:hypothetical protein
VKEEVAFYPDDAAVLAEDVKRIFHFGRVGGGCLCEFVDARRVEGAVFEEGFDGFQQILFFGAEGFLVGGESEAVFALSELFVSEESGD